MAPLPTLLKAAKGRVAELEKAQQEQQAGMESLEKEIAAKREERSIAAQGEVRELLKQKEVKMKEAKNLVGAVSVVGRAVAKLERAVDLGLDDWKALHTEKVKISDFLRKKIEDDPKALQGLREASSGASLELKDGSVEFCGNKALVPKLKAALENLEANYETWLEIEDQDTFSLLDARGEIGSLSKRHEVNIRMDGNWLGVCGPVKAADKVADSIKALLVGKMDIDCPKHLTGAATSKAKEVESETGAIVEVQRSGGWQGGGIIYLRGLEKCVEEATPLMRAWLDEHEGAVSEFINFSEDSATWTAPLFDQFRNDTQHMGQKFGIAVKQTGTAGQLELRGPADAVEQASKELHVMLDWYKKEHSAKEAQAKAKVEAEEPPAEPEDDWGAAPVAEPTPAAW